MATNQKMATHGNSITSEVQRILADTGTPEDQFVHWWTVPEEHIATAVKQMWCMQCGVTNIFFPICIPCICCAVKNTKSIAQSQVFILTQSKILAHHDAKLCCGSTGRDTKEHDLSTILSIQVDNPGSGCIKPRGGVVLTLPGIYVSAHAAGQNTFVLPCEDPNGAIKIIRDQKDKASQITLIVPQQMGMGAGNDDVIERLKKLKGLLDAGVITHSEFETKKANMLTEM